MNKTTGRSLTNGISAQINHLLWQHHPESLYHHIDPNFVKKIEQKDDPSTEYRNKMRGVYEQELQKSIMQHNLKQYKQNYEMEETRRDYRDKLNGILLELQKNDQQRKVYYKNCIDRQEEHKRRFIDDDKIKEQKVLDHIIKNYDKDKFYHGDDAYKQQQSNLLKQTIAIMGIQNHQLNKQKQDIKNEKNWQYMNRIRKQIQLQQLKKEQNTLKKQNQEKYSLELHKMVLEKNKLHPELKINRQQKHNPITNPIEYHIDNPYLLHKMQQKYHR